MTVGTTTGRPNKRNTLHPQSTHRKTRTIRTTKEWAKTLVIIFFLLVSILSLHSQFVFVLIGQGATSTESYCASLDLGQKSFSSVKDASGKTPFPSPSVKDPSDVDSELSRDDNWSAPPVLVSRPKTSGKNARISQMRLLAKAQKKSANSKNHQSKLPRKLMDKSCCN